MELLEECVRMLQDHVDETGIAPRYGKTVVSEASRRESDHSITFTTEIALHPEQLLWEVGVHDNKSTTWQALEDLLRATGIVQAESMTYRRLIGAWDNDSLGGPVGRLILRYIALAGELQFDRAIAGQVADELVEFVRDPTMDVRVLYHLEGAEIEADFELEHPESRIRLRRIDVDDLNLTLDDHFAQFLPHGRPSGPLPHPGDSAIELAYKIGGNAADSRWRRVEYGTCEDFVQFLHLITSGGPKVSPLTAGPVCRGPIWESPIRFGQPFDWARGDPMSLTRANIASMPERWPAFLGLIGRIRTERTYHEFRTGYERFQNSYRAHSLEDRFLQLYVAFETLLPWRGRSTYSRYLAMGALAHQEPSARRRTVRHLQKLGRVRNLIVHEGHTIQNAFGRLKIARDLSSICAEFQALIRQVVVILGGLLYGGEFRWKQIGTALRDAVEGGEPFGLLTDLEPTWGDWFLDLRRQGAIKKPKARPESES